MSKANTMTMAQARTLGYRVVRGAYQTTADDRMDRWYIEHESDRVVDRRGGGYLTRAAALEAIAGRVASE
ncbi:MAG TPA: hypothetical protein VLL76_07680 [Candidatus Omnitrophota bacterium]|nr:hypothetical protein [Candidatus Omnitrophota bacterium]